MHFALIVKFQSSKLDGIGGSTLGFLFLRSQCPSLPGFQCLISCLYLKWEGKSSLWILWKQKSVKGIFLIIKYYAKAIIGKN